MAHFPCGAALPDTNDLEPRIITLTRAVEPSVPIRVTPRPANAAVSTVKCLAATSRDASSRTKTPSSSSKSAAPFPEIPPSLQDSLPTQPSSTSQDARTMVSLDTTLNHLEPIETATARLPLNGPEEEVARRSRPGCRTQTARSRPSLHSLHSVRARTPCTR